MIAIQMYDKMTLREFVDTTGLVFEGRDASTMSTCLRTSSQVFIGKIAGELICSWGLIPPSLMSNQAYLWLYTTPMLAQHKFLFIRHSQRVVEGILETYPTIVGHVAIGNDLAFRWLRWLGATFGVPNGKLVPFRIEKHG